MRQHVPTYWECHGLLHQNHRSSAPTANLPSLALHQHLFPLTCRELWQLPGSESGADSSSKRKISARWQQTASQNKREGVRKPPQFIFGNRINHHVSSVVPWPSRKWTLSWTLQGRERERESLDMRIFEVFSNLIDSLILWDTDVYIYIYLFLAIKKYKIGNCCEDFFTTTRTTPN